MNTSASSRSPLSFKIKRALSATLGISTLVALTSVSLVNAAQNGIRTSFYETCHLALIDPSSERASYRADLDAIPSETRTTISPQVIVNLLRVALRMGSEASADFVYAVKQVFKTIPRQHPLLAQLTEEQYAALKAQCIEIIKASSRNSTGDGSAPWSENWIQAQDQSLRDVLSQTSGATAAVDTTSPALSGVIFTMSESGLNADALSALILSSNPALAKNLGRERALRQWASSIYFKLLLAKSTAATITAWEFLKHVYFAHHWQSSPIHAAALARTTKNQLEELKNQSGTNSQARLSERVLNQIDASLTEISTFLTSLGPDASKPFTDADDDKAWLPRLHLQNSASKDVLAYTLDLISNANALTESSSMQGFFVYYYENLITRCAQLSYRAFLPGLRNRIEVDPDLSPSSRTHLLNLVERAGRKEQIPLTRTHRPPEFRPSMAPAQTSPSQPPREFRFDPDSMTPGQVLAAFESPAARTTLASRVENAARDFIELYHDREVLKGFPIMKDLYDYALLLVVALDLHDGLYYLRESCEDQFQREFQTLSILNGVAPFIPDEQGLIYLSALLNTLDTHTSRVDSHAWSQARAIVKWGLEWLQNGRQRPAPPQTRP